MCHKNGYILSLDLYLVLKPPGYFLLIRKTLIFQKYIFWSYGSGRNLEQNLKVWWSWKFVYIDYTDYFPNPYSQSITIIILKSVIWHSRTGLFLTPAYTVSFWIQFCYFGLQDWENSKVKKTCKMTHKVIDLNHF